MTTRTVVTVISALLLTLLLTATAGCSEPAEAAAPGAREVAERVLAEAPAPRPPEAEPSLVDLPPLPAPAEPEPEAFVPPAPELREVDGLSVARLAVAPRVEGREPVGAGYEQAADHERLYVFVELRNERFEDSEVIVTFERPDGTVTGDVLLEVPARSPRWRTWMYSRYVHAPGRWTAVVRTFEGELLGRTEILVVP